MCRNFLRHHAEAGVVATVVCSHLVGEEVAANQEVDIGHQRVVAHHGVAILSEQDR